MREAHGKQRLIRDLRRLVGAAPAPAPAGAPRVGIAALSSGDWHLAIEQLLSHALRMRGADVSLLMCDVPSRPHCDERTAASRDRDTCAGCIHARRALLEAGGVPWQGVSSFIDAGAIDGARRASAALAAKELEDFRYRGWPLAEWSYVSACHYLKCDAHGDSPERIDARRRLVATGMVLIDAVERWLDTVAPDHVIVESGAHLEWRIVFELARARGINVICRELGKGGWDRHLFALNRDAMSPDLGEAWAASRACVLSDSEETLVDQLLENLPSATYVQRGPVERRAPGELRRELGVTAGRRVAVAFTNVTWDLATAGRDAAFDGMSDWLRSTVEAVRGMDVHLIVRMHPAAASVGMRDGAIAGIDGAHVSLVPAERQVAARDLCAMADVVLAYNSTVAIEAANAGLPVVLSGKPHFRGRGFTIDIDTRAQYAELLTAFADGSTIAAPAAARELARRYCHLFFARYTIPMGWTSSPLEPPYRLRMRSLDELRPGRNRHLDVVCDAILNGRQPLLPRGPC